MVPSLRALLSERANPPTESGRVSQGTFCRRESRAVMHPLTTVVAGVTTSFSVRATKGQQMSGLTLLTQATQQRR
jgi:hypothetical protein